MHSRTSQSSVKDKAEIHPGSANSNTINSRQRVYVTAKENHMKTKKIHMKDMLARHFQYGMTMGGVLSVNEGDSVVYSVNPECMTLMFGTQLGSQSEYFVMQQISLDWYSRSYGCKKVYFLCPECGNRALILHNSVSAFVCSQCNRLAIHGYSDVHEAQEAQVRHLNLA